MIKVTIIITASDAGDAAITLRDLVALQVEDGYLEGMQRGETGSYRFEVTEFTA